MGVDAWITIVVVSSVFLALLRNVAPPDLLFVVASAFLALVGVITPTEAFGGFSNSGMLTVLFCS